MNELQTAMRHAFSGKEDQGPDFGLPWLDFGARAYSPALRRWMTPDPLGEKYPAVNPYAYCAGDPVNYVDPTGMDIREIDERGIVRKKSYLWYLTIFKRIRDEKAFLRVGHTVTGLDGPPGLPRRRTGDQESMEWSIGRIPRGFHHR